VSIMAALTATQLVTLPSFSLPTIPDPPSKSVLALQGLDQALVDAEIVDPSIVLAIPLGDNEDGGTGLHVKVRRRLAELGINELFAGTDFLINCRARSRLHYVELPVQTKLLPFLLPTNPLQKGLYLPYDPPRDVCVSAPTGSGKTLAYVLPIVEVGNAVGPVLYYVFTVVSS
jgi:ATP-dependent RNA helicase DDX51/DBP6